MAHWNHRVVKKTHPDYLDENGDPQVTFGVHEVYYDDNNKPEICTVDPVEVTGNTWDEAYEEAFRFMRAFGKPTLDYDKDFPD